MKTRNILLALIIYLPLGSMAQKDISKSVLWKDEPVAWSCRAVRADESHFDFFLQAYLKRGWEIYTPNKRSKCQLSPLVIFDKSLGMRPLGEVEVIEGIECDTLMSKCLIPRYKSYVTFIQTFEMPVTMSQVVSGEVRYEVINRQLGSISRVYGFKLRVGDTVHMISADSAYKIGTKATHHKETEGRISDNNRRGFFRRIIPSLMH